MVNLIMVSCIPLYLVSNFLMKHLFNVFLHYYYIGGLMQCLVAAKTLPMQYLGVYPNTGYLVHGYSKGEERGKRIARNINDRSLPL